MGHIRSIILTYIDLSMPKEECGPAARAVAGKVPVAYLLAMTAAQTDRSASTPSVASAHDKILILDFGSQVTQLIARRVRENGVYCEIQPYTATEAQIRAFSPRSIILSGGPASVTVAATPRAPDIVFRLGVPVLAICYGMQTMCAQLGGRVTLSDHQEFGRAFIDVRDECRLFEGLWPKGAREQVWMSHGDKIDALPPDFRPVAVSDGAPFAAAADDGRRFYGVLFHPEVVHTPQGGRL